VAGRNAATLSRRREKMLVQLFFRKMLDSPFFKEMLDQLFSKNVGRTFFENVGPTFLKKVEMSLSGLEVSSPIYLPRDR
jgi:hypothetical protein